MRGIRILKHRFEWMDFLRGVAIVLVISAHSSAILTLFQVAIPEWFMLANESLAPYRMPTLMLLSGMLISRSLAKPVSTYYWGKLRAAGYPFVLWTLMYALVVGIDADWYDPKFWMASSYLWFLQFIFIYYLLAPLLRRVSNWVLAITPIAFSLFLEDNSVGQRFFFMAGFFFLGAVVAEHPRAVSSFLSSNRAYWLAIPAIVCSTLSTLAGPITYLAEYSLLTAAGIGLAVRLAHIAQGRRWARGLQYIGRHSIKFYVSHFPVIYISLGFSITLGLPVSSGILIAFSSALGVGFLLAFASGRSFAKYAFEAPDVLAAIPRSRSY